MMKSKHNNVIQVRKIKTIGTMPSIISFGHRHLEKESDGKGKVVSGVTEFTIPIELINMTVPPRILEGIDEVIFGYKRK